MSLFPSVWVKKYIQAKPKDHAKWLNLWHANSILFIFVTNHITQHLNMPSNLVFLYPKCLPYWKSLWPFSPEVRLSCSPPWWLLSPLTFTPPIILSSKFLALLSHLNFRASPGISVISKVEWFWRGSRPWILNHTFSLPAAQALIHICVTP